MLLQQEFISLIEKVLSLDHLAFRAQGNLWKTSHTNGNRAETQKSMQESHSAREREFAERREVRDSVRLRADQAAEREESSSSELFEAEYLTRVLIEEQRNQILSGARSEMTLQELQTESASANQTDKIRILSHGTPPGRSRKITRREQVWLQAEFGRTRKNSSRNSS